MFNEIKELEIFFLNTRIAQLSLFMWSCRQLSLKLLFRDILRLIVILTSNVQHQFSGGIEAFRKIPAPAHKYKIVENKHIRSGIVYLVNVLHQKTCHLIKYSSCFTE